MTSSQILGIAASSAGMVIGLQLGSWWNKKYGINRKRGALIILANVVFWIAVIALLALGV